MPSATSARTASDGTDDAAPSDTVLRLDAPARSASVAIIRQTVSGTGTAIGLRPGAVADLRLALSEICGAAIRRLDGAGRLEVEARAGRDALRVAVRDDAPSPAISSDGQLPLPLVAAITDAVELHQRAGGGTEVVMTFLLDDAPPA